MSTVLISLLSLLLFGLPSVITLHEEIPAPGETVVAAFPLPNSEVYGLTGLDAVLHDAVVEEFSTRATWPDLLIPSLSVIDSFPLEDGERGYICILREHDYYDLGHGLSDLSQPQYKHGAGANPIRLNIASAQDGSLYCSALIPSGDGEGWECSIRTICGPKEAIAEWMIHGGSPPIEPREITPADQDELLRIYLDYYFLA